MDTLTHALSGALLARATARAKPAAGVVTADSASAPLSLRARVLLGFFAAAFPDSDVVLAWFSPVAYLTQHRGLTHSWLMLPIWVLLLAWLIARLRRDARGVRPYLGVLAIGIAIHILGDWITSFGTMMFAPLSDHRYALGATFIIDLIFTGIILAGLLASLIWRRSRVPAMAGLVLLCGYVAFQWTQQQQALAFGERYAQAQGFSGYRVSALPRAVSPFNWSVYVTTPERYHLAHINLRRPLTLPEPGANANLFARLDAGYRAAHDAQWQIIEQFGADESQRARAREAWGQSTFGFYRWFAAFPYLDQIEQSSGETCVWFADARFSMPGRSTRMFHYGLCRADASDQWRTYKLNNDSSKTAI